MYMECSQLWAFAMKCGSALTPSHTRCGEHYYIYECLNVHYIMYRVPFIYVIVPLRYKSGVVFVNGPHTPSYPCPPFTSVSCSSLGRHKMATSVLTSNTLCLQYKPSVLQCHVLHDTAL